MALRPFDGLARKISLPILVICAIGWILYVIGFGWLENNAVADAQEEYDDAIDNSRTLPTQGPFNRFHGAFRISGLATANGVNDYDREDLARDITELSAASIVYINYRFIYFCFAIVGPLMLITMTIHLLIAHPFTGIVANAGVAIYIATGGGILFLDGVIISLYNRILDGTDSGDTLTDLEFGRYLNLEFAGCFISILFIAIHMGFWSAFTNPRTTPLIGSRRNATDYAHSTATTTAVGYPNATTYQPAGQYMAQPIRMVPMVAYPPPGAFIMQQAVPQTTATTVTTDNEAQLI